jgi:hypothetical protein
VGAGEGAVKTRWLAGAPDATHVRGTLLVASTHTLKRHGHYERYKSALAPDDFEAIVSSAAGMWLPIERWASPGLPVSAIRYFRIAYRGFIQAGCEFFARRVVVATTLAYRIAWV